MNKNNKGFTLVELLAVIVIMGILLLVAIPGVFGISNTVKENIYCKKVSDIEAAAKLYGQDFVDDIEERGYIQISVKTLIDNNMYRKESDECELGSEDNPCVTDPRDYSAMDNDVITILKKEKRFSSYFNYHDKDIDICEGKKIDDQFGEYEIQLEHNGATYAPQDTVKVKFGQIPDPIIPPKKEFLVNLDSSDGTYYYHDTQTVKFTFRGYYLTDTRDTMYFNPEGKGVKYYNHTTDRVLFAAWDPNPFVLPTLSRQGYNFTGWWDRQTGGNRIGKPGMKFTPASNNVTIYGQWSPIEAIVTLHGQGAYSPSPDEKITATYDLAMPTLTTLPKRRYTMTYNYNGSEQANTTATPEATFLGYYLQPNNNVRQYYNADGKSAHLWDVASSTADLYAHWSTVTTKLPTPDAREGYEFLGWYTSATGGTKVGNAGSNYTFTGNKTLYAHWTGQAYTITFDSAGANYEGTKTTSVKYLEKVPGIVKPTKYYRVTYDYVGGYGEDFSDAQLVFKGYFTEKGGKGTKYYDGNGNGLIKYPKKEGITLYAYWEKGKIRFPRAYKNGFLFLGWFTQPAGGTKLGYEGIYYTPTSNVTVYAHWSVQGGKCTKDNKCLATASKSCKKEGDCTRGSWQDGTSCSSRNCWTDDIGRQWCDYECSCGHNVTGTDPSHCHERKCEEYGCPSGYKEKNGTCYKMSCAAGTTANYSTFVCENPYLVDVQVTIRYFARNYNDSVIINYTDHNYNAKSYTGAGTAADQTLTFNVKSGTKFYMKTRNGSNTELYAPGFKAGSIGSSGWEKIGTDTFYFEVPNYNVSLEWYWSESQEWNQNRRYVPCVNCGTEVVLSK